MTTTPAVDALVDACRRRTTDDSDISTIRDMWEAVEALRAILRHPGMTPDRPMDIAHRAGIVAGRNALAALGIPL